MNSMLLSLWDDFTKWVSVDWSQTTYIIVVCIFGLLGLLSLLSFFKGNFDKGKKVKWSKLILALLLFGLLALVSFARFTNG